MKKILLPLMGLLIFTASSFAANAEVSSMLPTPTGNATMDVFKAINKRSSSRAFEPADLSKQQLADILWAAGGKNSSNKWNIPFAMKTDPTLKIYVTSEKGTFLYNGTDHALVPVSKEDLRKKIASQDFVSTAPCVLMLVISPRPLLAKKQTSFEAESASLYISAGATMQNVYLATTVEGLATCYVASINKGALKDIIAADEEFLGVMPIGQPKK